MARRRYGRRRGRRGGLKIPVISLAILGGQVGSAYAAAGGDLKGTLSRFASYYAGYEAHTNTWQPAHLLIGYGPWIVKRFAMAIARPRIAMRGLPISFS